MSEHRTTARIGHVHLKVSDLDRSERFYQDVLGLLVTERVGTMFSFLSAGSLHHDVALQERAAAAPVCTGGLGLYHAAFEIDDEAALAAVLDRLDKLAVPYAPVDHGISKAVYFDDPDGNGLEVYVDTRHRRALWQGRDEPVRDRLVA